MYGQQAASLLAHTAGRWTDHAFLQTTLLEKRNEKLGLTI